MEGRAVIVGAIVQVEGCDHSPVPEVFRQLHGAVALIGPPSQRPRGGGWRPLLCALCMHSQGDCAIYCPPIHGHASDEEDSDHSSVPGVCRQVEGAVAVLGHPIHGSAGGEEGSDHSPVPPVCRHVDNACLLYTSDAADE